MYNFFLTAFGIIVLLVNCDAQKYDLRLKFLSEHYYVQNFDLWSQENNSSSYFTAIPSPRIGIGLGMNVSSNSSIALSYSFGSISTSAKIYTDQSQKTGRMFLTELSSQISISYEYSVWIRDDLRVHPKLEFVFNRSMYDYRRQSYISGIDNAIDFNIVVSYEAVNFWDYYSSLGLGSIFQYDIDDRYSISLNILYHKAWLQYLLRSLDGNYTNEGIRDINTSLVLTSGTRWSNSITVYDKLGNQKK